MSLIAWAGAAFAPKEKLVSLRVAARLVLLRHPLVVSPPPFSSSSRLVVGQEDQDAEGVEDKVGPPYAQ